MIPNQTFGYCPPVAGQCEYLTLAISPLSAPLRSRWRNNGLSADFLGDYVSTFLPADSATPAAERRQKEIRHAVIYIANELLENAMKYHERELDFPIGILLELSIDHIVVSASNAADAAQATRYKTFVERILVADASALLMDQLEENSSGPQSGASNLGLLTMITDYGARLGWRFEALPSHPGTMTVTTSAVLPLQNLPGVSA